MNRWLSKVWYQFNFCLAYLMYTFGWSFKTRGTHHVPPDGPVLILANHESFLDPVAIGLAVRRRLNYLARKTLFSHPVFGRYLSSVGCVAVDQAGVAKGGLKASIELLRAGKALLIFPEGERAWDGVLQPFKQGVLLILRRAPVTIVPVGVAGAFEAYPRKAKTPRFSPLFWQPTGAGIACSVGEPIPPERYEKLEPEELLDLLFRAVKGEVEQAEKLRLKR
jgi:1-acyl-sn-glycerol-3-phosphate acyltransferase